MRRRGRVATTRDNVIDPRVIVRLLEVMPDASGAPAVLEFRGYAFALDQLGETTVRVVEAPPDATRAACRVARSMCEHAYATLLECRVTEDWRERNALMYDDALTEMGQSIRTTAISGRDPSQDRTIR